MSSKKLELPEPVGIKEIERDSSSIYLRWAILSSHGLTTEQLTDLDFEFKTTDNKLRADCGDHTPAHEYKARLCGLCSDTKYRFQVRSKLALQSGEVLTSTWSNRIEIRTRPPMNNFIIISNEKELETESLKHQVRQYKNENKKLSLRIEQLETQLDQSIESVPGHWQWDYRKIVNWIMRIGDGQFKQYKKQLTKTLKEEGITGKDLVMVTESNLKEWGITNFNQRKVLMHYIATLTENDTKPEITYDPTLTKHLSRQMSEDQKVSKVEESTKSEIENVESKESESVEVKESESVEVKESESNPEFPKRNAGISASVQALLDSTDEPKEWKYKEGMLSVLVVKATNVDNLDEGNWNKETASASDPYVELDLKGNYKKEKTKAHQNSENPVWNEKFQLFVDDAKNDVLKCEIYDHDKFTMDQKVGTVCVPIITVLGANGYVRKEFDVIGSKIGCKLELELKYWESLR